MRVAWVVDGDLDQLSGGYLYDRIIVDFLRTRGVHVDAISLPRAAYFRRLTARPPAELDRLLDTPYDFVIQDELSHPALIRSNRRLARAAPKLRRVALVHHLRSSEPRSWLLNAFYRLVERTFLRSVDGFIFNSQATRSAVQSLTGDHRPWVVAVPGADRLGGAFSPEAVEARATLPGPLRILFVANLIPRKGLLTLIDAMALLPAGAASLTIVGDPQADPQHAARLRKRIQRLGLRVELRGALDREEVSRAMEAHHVLAIPSSYEGYGMAYLEGMGRGLPAIAGTAGGAAEFVRDGENGFRVDPGDPAGLAARLVTLARDRRLLVTLSRAALRTYVAHPTWEATGTTILRFLGRLTGTPPTIGVSESELQASVLSSGESVGHDSCSSPEVGNEP